jgi:hypothetical protein
MFRLRTGCLDALTEDVFEEEPEPGRRLIFREDVLYQCEDLGDCVQIEHFGELLDVFPDRSATSWAGPVQRLLLGLFQARCRAA